MTKEKAVRTPKGKETHRLALEARRLMLAPPIPLAASAPEWAAYREAVTAALAALWGSLYFFLISNEKSPIYRICEREDCDPDDAIQECYFILLRCLCRFDPTFGFLFNTYFFDAVHRSLAMRLRKLRNIVHVPLNREDVVRGRCLGLPDDLEILARDEEEAGDDRADDRARLALALGGLDPREREVVDLRFGLGGVGPLRLVDVGERFGVSKERVRQVQERAMAKVCVALGLAAGAREPRLRPKPVISIPPNRKASVPA